MAPGRRLRVAAVWALHVGSAGAFSTLGAPRASARLRGRALAATHVVVYTSYEDLRVIDHGGLCAVSADDSCTDWLAVLALDGEAVRGHRGKRVAAAAAQLSASLEERYGAQLLIRKGEDLGDVLAAALQNAGEGAVCHVVGGVIETGVADRLDRALDRVRGAVEVRRWAAPLRPRGDPWAAPNDGAEAFEAWRFEAYLRDECAVQPPADPEPAPAKMPAYKEGMHSDGLECIGGGADVGATRGVDTTEPFLDVAFSMAGCASAAAGVRDYLNDGRAAFAGRHFKAANAGVSLHAAAAYWVAGNEPGAVAARLALREPAQRAFGPALALGAMSAREVSRAAADAGGWPLGQGGFASDGTGWPFRGDAGALQDVVEWREWHARLARAGPAHDAYWAWGASELAIRYRKFGSVGRPDAAPAGVEKYAFILVHGFGASSDQWSRLAAVIAEAAPLSADVEMFAMDLIGFGNAAKPGVSYTQHLWEAQIVDFCDFIAPGHKIILAGNSIGGGLAAGAIANLGKRAAGLVLCNTAGTLADEQSDETVPALDVTARTLAGALEPFSPPPGGQPLLDFFGQGVISALTPQIGSLLKRYYPVNPDNADEELASGIARASGDPGAANVIGSGAKLCEQRLLDEVLGDMFTGPILVAQGRLDYVSGPERAQKRAGELSRLRAGVQVDLLESGHCPHDETPELVAASVHKWLAANFA
ncbi:Alpha/Beta hydrolase protein [Pelagophyceae sp. CCMP2097]|nr:Alpha/Beta hydrolase protein [Pelagophyceae sp. CCMP2097]|mmetsp:Transcript_4679/g.16490  ORF Transcript_4679/g.16490 Transcript_4679/m.16490 type:complete len:706 (-) Transcript_4679:61-2178(-)